MPPWTRSSVGTVAMLRRAYLATLTGALVSGWITLWLLLLPSGGIRSRAMGAALLLMLGLPASAGLITLLAAPVLFLIWLPLWTYRRKFPVLWRRPVAPVVGAIVGVCYWTVASAVYDPFSDFQGPANDALFAAQYVAATVGIACMFAAGSHSAS